MMLKTCSLAVKDVVVNMNLTTVPLLMSQPSQVKGFYIIKVLGGYNLVAQLHEKPDSTVALHRNPFEARLFKTIKAAVNIATKLGHNSIKVRINVI